ncbi:MAG: hypothetical protein M3P96_04965 [Actinomycetota bacterium]|nr:hypothetical protein [Actinomycetota bacterium]
MGYLGLLLAGLALVFTQHSRDDAGARAEAQARYEQILADCERYQQESPGPPEGAPEGFEEPPCAEQVPSADQMYLDPRFRVVTQLPELILASSVTWAMVAFLVGASALGADWSSRTLPALLTWEPRRSRVLLTKLAAVLLATGLVAVLVQAITFAAGWLLGSLRGTFERAPAYSDAPPIAPNVWELMLHQSGRGILLALITVTMGFAAAGFFPRHRRRGRPRLRVLHPRGVRAPRAAAAVATLAVHQQRRWSASAGWPAPAAAQARLQLQRRRGERAVLLQRAPEQPRGRSLPGRGGRRRAPARPAALPPARDRLASFPGCSSSSRSHDRPTDDGYGPGR